jgi:deoxycytidine triphosphate deaminase
MTVVDLLRRITIDEDSFRNAICSDESLILIKSKKTVGHEISSIDLTVGDRIFDSAASEPRAIPTGGLILRAGQAAVVYTDEQVWLPHNVFGLVAGKGTLIFHGVFISPGKIDPGFQDRLRIGILNASNAPLRLTPGMAICSCTFFQMESHVNSATTHHLTEPVKPVRPSVAALSLAFCRENWKWGLTTIIAVVGATAAVIRALR